MKHFDCGYNAADSSIDTQKKQIYVYIEKVTAIINSIGTSVASQVDMQKLGDTCELIAKVENVLLRDNEKYCK